MEMLLLLMVPFLVVCFVTLIVTPVVIFLAKRTGLIDDPKTHKHPAVIHKKPIPRAGGLAIFIGLLVGFFVFLPQDATFTPIMVAGAIVVFIGLLDDKFDLSPYVRFFGNIICAVIAVSAGATIPYITNPLGGILHFNSIVLPIFGDVFTIPVGLVLAVIWIVWVMNMLNWSKGVDGQMPGVVIISALIIGLSAIRFSTLTSENLHTAQLAFMVAGAGLGFLFYNFYPAKIFPGYSATIFGFLIGVLSILSGVKLATAILVMGVPTADALVTITRRLLTKKSPFWHDKGHLHHLLLDLGFDQRSIAIFYWIMSLLLGVFALTLSSKGKLFAIILVVVMVSGLIFSLKYLIRREEK